MNDRVIHVTECVYTFDTIYSKSTLLKCLDLILEFSINIAIFLNLMTSSFRMPR